MKTPEKKIIKKLEQIGLEVTGIETLETRKSDSLDFHDLSVWQIRELLTRAYEAGKKTRS